MGAIQLQTIELPDQLRFVYGYESGWVDLAAPPAALLAAVIWAGVTHHLIFAAIFVVAFGALVVYWLNISPARLSVSQRELIAQGSQNRNLTNQTNIPAVEVNTLRYAPAGDYGPAGLYAYCRRRQICLIPGVAEEQAIAIAEAIRAKFPNIERGDNLPAHMEFPEQHR